MAGIAFSNQNRVIEMDGKSISYDELTDSDIIGGKKLVIGDRVYLTHSDFSRSYARADNPHYESRFSCGGTVTQTFVVAAKTRGRYESKNISRGTVQTGSKTKTTMHAESNLPVPFNNYVFDIDVLVNWDNGELNSYGGFHLSLEKDLNIPQERSYTFLTKDVKVGDTIIVKRGSKVFVEGDFIHDCSGQVVLNSSILDGDFLKDKI
jgi:hypothetical protein